MQYLSILLLLVGCAATSEKQELSQEELENRRAGMIRTCDFMIGPPRNSETYVSCMEYVEAEFQ